jgi:phage terminase large subunit-like protein
MAVDIITATKDKVTRLKEKESDFTQGNVVFLPGTENLQDRVARFPNVKKDDIVDAMVYSLESGTEIFV